MAISTSAAVDAIVLSENLLLGNRDVHSIEEYEQHGGTMPCDYGGFNSFCEALKPTSIKHLDLSKCRLDASATSGLADAFKFMGALNSVVLDENELTGTKIKYKGTRDERIERLDADLSGFTEFCSSLKSSTIVSLSLRKCYLGPQAVVLLADAIKVIATVNLLTLDSTGNMRYQKTYTLTAGEEKIDLSQKNLGSADAALLTSWLQRPEVAAAVDNIDLSGCGLAGATKTKYIGDGKCTWENIDSSMDGFIALCAVIGKVHTIRLADCGLGPRSTAELSKVFTNADATIARLTIDSTGVPNKIGGSRIEREASGPRTYTLTVGKEEIDLSKKNLGSADVALVATWLQRPEVSAVLTSINCLANGFGEDDLATLLTAIEGTSVRSLCGLSEGQTAADFSGFWTPGFWTPGFWTPGFWTPGQKLGPIDCKIMAAEYGFQGFIAAVTSMNCLHNPLGEGVHTIIEAFEETPRLRTLCGLEEGVEQIDWSKSGKGPADIALLAADVKAGRAAAALNSLTLDSNGIFGTLDSNGIFGRHGKPDEFAGDCDAFFAALKASNILALSLQNTGIGPLTLRNLATALPATIARLTLSGNMITSSSRGFLRGEFTSHDGDLSGLISLCDALPALQNPIDLDLSDCGLLVSGVNPVVHAIQAGSVGAVSLSGCQLEPVMVAQVLSVASEVSRLRLRAAQVLAFCCALHDRMGADSAVCDMVDNGVVDIWQIVASMVRAQHGNEALRSTLACQNPWYEVCVRGLVPRRVPHWERRQ